MLQKIVAKPRKLDDENSQQSFKNWKNNAQKILDKGKFP